LRALSKARRGRVYVLFIIITEDIPFGNKKYFLKKK